MDSRARTSSEQFATLMEFMESHGDLTKPQPGPQGRIRADRLWQELANSLNSIGGGVNKTPDKWKKVWADWKSKTKKKALAIRRHASGTGGGPKINTTLTALESRVLAIIGPLAVEGHPEIEEQGFDRPPTPPPPPPQSVGLDVIEEGISTQSGSPPLPDVWLTYPPSTSRLQHQTPAAARHSPPLPEALEPSASTSRPQRATPTPAATHHSPPPADQPMLTTRRLISPPSSITSPRRRRVGARRRRTLTPFDRAASEFVAIEQHRLRLEESRIANEGLMLANEARRIEVEHERNDLLRRFAGVADAFLQYLQSRDRSQ